MQSNTADYIRERLKSAATSAGLLVSIPDVVLCAYADEGAVTALLYSSDMQRRAFIVFSSDEMARNQDHQDSLVDARIRVALEEMKLGAN